MPIAWGRILCGFVAVKRSFEAELTPPPTGDWGETHHQPGRGTLCWVDFAPPGSSEPRAVVSIRRNSAAAYGACLRWLGCSGVPAGPASPESGAYVPIMYARQYVTPVLTILDELGRSALAAGPDLLIGLVLALTTWFAAKWVQRAIVKHAPRLRGDAVVWGYLGNAVRILLQIIGWVTALQIMHVPVEALLATLGISGVIIGFGARQSIANLFFGMMLLAAKPFKQGDLVQYGRPAQIGRVTELRLSHTSLVSQDNVRVVAPNSVMWRTEIANFSSLDRRAIRIPLAVPYDVDMDWVEDLALDVLRGHEQVADDPAPRFTVSNVTPDEVRALLVAWSRADQMHAFGAIVTQAREAFEAAGLAVTIPAADVDLQREE